MNDSTTVTGSGLHWFGACLFALVMAVLPIGHAQAADLEAVERRLGEAVVDGELSLAEAAQMMEVLKHMHRDGNHDKSRDIHRQLEHWVDQVGEDLRRAVDAGRISEKDAWKKWHHFKEHELAPKLKAAVKDGHMREEAAIDLWHALEKAEKEERSDDKKHAGQPSHDKPDWAAIKRKVEGAVKAGKMSREEADKVYEDIKKKMSSDGHSKATKGDAPGRANAHEQLKNLRNKLGAAVKAGKISEEDAERQYEHAERVIKERSESNDRRKSQHKSPTKEDYIRAEAALKKMVAAGKLSPEQAQAKLEAMRRMIEK